MSAPRKIVFVLLALAICAVVFFAVAEAYSRARYEDPYLTGLMERSPAFHHLPPPYYSGTMRSDGDFDLPFSTNNRGMRGPGDYAYAKSEGVFRVAVLGDSFVFGVGVRADETASAVLERLLDGGDAGRYEVYNFGVNSFSPLLEYLYLTQEALAYRPDLVVLMLDLCDVQDDFLYEPHIVRDAEGEIIGCDPLRKGGRPDWYALARKYSRFIARLDTKLIDSIRKMRMIGLGAYMRNKFEGKRNKAEIITDPALDNLRFDRFLFSREGKDAGIVDRHWQRTAEYLGMIKERLDAEGIPLLIVVYPYGHHVGPDQWAVGRRYWGFEEGRVYDPAAAVGRVAAFARKHDIDLISMVDTMRAHAGERLYFDRDGHMTPRGQEILAETMYADPAFRREAGMKTDREGGGADVADL